MLAVPVRLSVEDALGFRRLSSLVGQRGLGTR